MAPYTDHLIALVFAAACAWSAFRVGRSGQVHAPFGSVIATRSDDRTMFWTYLCCIVAVGALAALYGFGLVG